MSAIVLLVSILINQAHAEMIDRSHSVFLPSSLSQKLGNYQAFPVFWWNFLVLEPDQKEFATELCLKLKAEPDLKRVECLPEFTDFVEVAGDWARDVRIRREKPHDQEIKKQFRVSMAKSGMISSKEGLELLRLDPLETWRDLQKLAEERIPIKWPRVDGFFFDQASGRTLIPIQFSFPPENVPKTKDFWEKYLRARDVSIFGPHWGSMQNELRIKEDLAEVSWIGTVLLMAVMAGLIFLRRGRVIWIMLPVFLGTGLAVAITVLFFGSIHGLTIAFGTAIIGLAMDYGLHGAFTKGKRVWVSNFYGLLTTFAGLLILMMSSIPLIRQMMFFSAAGLLSSYLLLFFTFQIFASKIQVAGFRGEPLHNRFKGFFAVLLCLSGIAGLSFLRPSLDLRQLEFQDQRTKEIISWMQGQRAVRAPLFQTFDDANLGESHELKKWALERNIRIETQANYFPKLETQAKNQMSWDCSTLKNISSTEELEFFAPFFEGPCKTSSPTNSYGTHIMSGARSLTMWYPQSHEEEILVRGQYPNSVSLRELVETFPATLLGELKWMAPLSAVLACLLIFFHFKSLLLTAIALIPFLTGLGLVTLIHIFFKTPFSFVSLIGVIMIFGFSIDYGIFVADAESEGRKDSGIWSAITLASLTTLAGFFPLLFCGHPVLLHLGQILFYGTFGTYLGAFWGIPSFSKWIKKH